MIPRIAIICSMINVFATSASASHAVFSLTQMRLVEAALRSVHIAGPRIRHANYDGDQALALDFSYRSGRNVCAGLPFVMEVTQSNPLAPSFYFDLSLEGQNERIHVGYFQPPLALRSVANGDRVGMVDQELPLVIEYAPPQAEVVIGEDGIDTRLIMEQYPFRKDQSMGPLVEYFLRDRSISLSDSSLRRIRHFTVLLDRLNSHFAAVIHEIALYPAATALDNLPRGARELLDHQAASLMAAGCVSQ